MEWYESLLLCWYPKIDYINKFSATEPIQKYLAHILSKKDFNAFFS